MKRFWINLAVTIVFVALGLLVFSHVIDVKIIRYAPVNEMRVGYMMCHNGQIEKSITWWNGEAVRLNYYDRVVFFVQPSVGSFFAGNVKLFTEPSGSLTFDKSDKQRIRKGFFVATPGRSGSCTLVIYLVCGRESRKIHIPLQISHPKHVPRQEQALQA
ncbi:hypothetical protein KJ764_00965 [Patescibacteria group bacterium]|nr:hypothetical protein [Patescibacteria group bacterium]